VYDVGGIDVAAPVDFGWTIVELQTVDCTINVVTCESSTVTLLRADTVGVITCVAVVILDTISVVLRPVDDGLSVVDTSWIDVVNSAVAILGATVEMVCWV
jgi:hypothetical protein